VGPLPPIALTLSPRAPRAPLSGPRLTAPLLAPRLLSAPRPMPPTVLKSPTLTTSPLPALGPTPDGYAAKVVSLASTTAVQLPSRTSMLSSSDRSPTERSTPPPTACSAPSPSSPTPARWRPRGCNFSSMESTRRRMASSRSSIVLPKPIPDCGLMVAKAEHEPLDTKLSPAREMGVRLIGKILLNWIQD
jgi:hypothetical protein